MKKIQTKQGLVAYHTRATETTLIGGLGICDECNEAVSYGYLVPVLNHWQCPACFSKWESRAKYYQEDEPFEKANAAYYESKIPLTEDEGDESG